MPITKPVLIIGGGINGVAIARELLLSGLSVILVEKHDLGFGASSKLSRLAHGGLRYLEYGDISLLKESLAERNRLLKLAPHFVKPLRLKIPLSGTIKGWLQSFLRFSGISRTSWGNKLDQRYASKGKGSILVRAGLAMYDLISWDKTLPGYHLRKSSKDVDQGLDLDKYPTIAEYSDARITSPERFLMALIHDCKMLAQEMSLTFSVYTHHTVSLHQDSAQIHPVDSRLVTWEFQPYMMINATGAWGDITLQEMNVPSQKLLQGTVGTHILTTHQGLTAILNNIAYYVETADGRLVFIIPQEQSVLIGTTEIPLQVNPSQVVPSNQEINYLLDVINSIFPSLNLTAQDVTGAFAGVRPLPYQPIPGKMIPRHDQLIFNKSRDIPILTVLGGKWTTFRAVAEKVNHALWNLEGLPAPSSSRDRVLPGSHNYPATPQAQLEYLKQLHRRYEMPLDQLQAVFPYLGTLTEKWLAETIKLPILSPFQSPVLPGTNLPISFIEWIIQEEFVLRLEDLVERRLMLWEYTTITHQMLTILMKLLIDAGRYHPDETSDVLQKCIMRFNLAYKINIQ